MPYPPPSDCVGGNPSEKASGNDRPVEAHRQAHTDLLLRRVGMTCPDTGDRELPHGLAERVRLFETLVRRLRPQELVIAIEGGGARVPMHSMSLPHRQRVAPTGWRHDGGPTKLEALRGKGISPGRRVVGRQSA